jgi:hypothetical protein
MPKVTTYLSPLPPEQLPPSLRPGIPPLTTGLRLAAASPLPRARFLAGQVAAILSLPINRSSNRVYRLRWAELVSVMGWEDAHSDYRDLVGACPGGDHEGGEWWLDSYGYCHCGRCLSPILPLTGGSVALDLARPVVTFDGMAATGYGRISPAPVVNDLEEWIGGVFPW